MKVLRSPSVLIALSCVLLAATVTPTALGCQVAASAGEADDAHACCKGKKHGAACPVSLARAKSDPSCPAMRGCDTTDNLLMQLLGQAGFVPERLVAVGAPASLVGVVSVWSDVPRVGTHAPEPPPPRI